VNVGVGAPAPAAGAAPPEPPRGPFRIGLGEVTGAVADLGTFVPLATALILVNGLDATSVLVCAGLLAIAAGVVFRVPFPVQPLKALTAVAVASGLAPEVIHIAGLELAGFLLLLSIAGVADAIARVFTKPVVRALQLGVGVLLVVTAARLVTDPPDVFAATPSTPWPWFLAIGAFAVVVVAARTRRYWAALVVLAGGAAVAAFVATPDLAALTPALPRFTAPDLSQAGTALFLLVIPQLPLTFGNAVVAVSDLSHDYFGPGGARVSPSRVCRLAGAGNGLAAVLGGMPMCHGSGGLTAHVRLGARSAGMNLLLGGGLITMGVLLGAQVPEVLGLLPSWGLAAFLAYAGLRHAGLVADLRGVPLVAAIVAGALGAWLGNLAVTAVIALAVAHLPILWPNLWPSRRRMRSGTAGTLGR